MGRRTHEMIASSRGVRMAKLGVSLSVSMCHGKLTYIRASTTGTREKVWPPSDLQGSNIPYLPAYVREDDWSHVQ